MTLAIDAERAASLSESKRALLARRLRGAAPATGPAVVPPRPPGPLPLSPAQRTVWLADQISGGDAAYTVHRTMLVRGRLDQDALRRAADVLVARHEVLRTAVHGDHQVVRPPGPADFAVVASTAVSADERRAEAHARARDEVARTFDLADEALVRFRVYPVDAGESLVVINQHHIITDGWSCAILARELCETYTALVQGLEPAADPAVQFGDLVAVQAATVSDDERARQCDYWADQLGDLPDGLALPTDRVRPPRQTHNGGAIVRALPVALSDAVRAYAGVHGTTVHNVLLSAFATLLGRYSAQDRFAIGALVSGRSTIESERALGLFANTIAVPVDLRDRPSFTDVLGRIDRSVRGALDHQDVAFDQIVARIGVPRDPSRNPIFQVVFQCVEATEEVWRLPDATVEHLDLHNGTTKGDLTLVAVNNGHGPVGLEFTYSTDLFERTTAERLIDHWETLIEGCLAAPETPFETIELLTAGQRAQVRDEWNATTVPYPDVCVHELFEQQVRRTPDATAIVDVDGSTVTYRELDARANQVARHLRDAGVGVEHVVGLCLPQSPLLHAALLGILKAGACYLPLDPAHPIDRLLYMVGDAGASIILVAERTAGIFADFAGETIVVDTDRGLAEQSSAPLGPSAGPDNLIYTMYTSGSTGRPKGVLVTHRGVVNYLLWAVNGYGVEGGSGAPMVGSIAFDLSVPNFMLPLISGRDVTILPESEQIEALADLLSGPGDFSLLKITPGHLDALRHLLRPGVTNDAVRTYVVGADELRPDTVVGWRKIAPNSRIINEYGPTETVVGCSVYVIGDEFDPNTPVSIGRPIANTRMYVLDAHGQLVPPGVVGELFIGGAGVARGYGGRAALTADRFMPDPYAVIPGSRMYRTGDLARFRADGNIDFLGRIDHQVKIRGYRVELAEVEARLLAHPDIDEAVVVAVDTGGYQRLAAYVAPRPGGTPTAREVRRFAADALPEYMVPALWTIMERLPLTDGGKVDRKSLPDPVVDTPDTPTVPTTGVAAVLAGLWADVLGVPVVGADDNFFALGGDSMLAVRVARKARDEGLLVAPAMLFVHQTVADLAAALDRIEAEPTEVSTGTPATDDPFPLAGVATADLAKVFARVPRARVVDVYRLSPLQAGMLFQTLAEPDRAANVEQFVIAIEGELAPGALRAAWQTLVDRHPVLRTTFAWRGLRQPVQLVHHGVDLEWTENDWTAVDPAEHEERLLRTLDEDRERGFALDVRTPHRYRLVSFGPADHRLVWTFHHLLFDGWSMPLLAHELLLAYAGLTGVRAPALKEPVPFRDYIDWLSRRDDAASTAYWRDRLAGLPGPTTLPMVVPAREGEVSTSAASLHITMGAELTAQVQAFARGERVTVGTVTHGAWALLVARLTGNDDVVFGTTLAGRDAQLPGAGEIVGLLMNTVPTRARISDQPVGPWLRCLQRELAETLSHGHFALADIQRAAGYAGPGPLFESIFAYENFETPAGDVVPGLRLRLAHAVRQSGYPIIADVSLHGELAMRLDYDPSRVGAQVVDLPDLYRDVLVGIVSGSAPRVLARPERGAQDVERALAKIWCEVLGLRAVRPEDSFVALGGDSIRAMQIVARARDFGIERRPSDLFKHPTLAELAALSAGTDEPVAEEVDDEDGYALAELPEETLRDLLSTMDTDAVEDLYRLAPLQVSMLFEHLAADDDVYLRQFVSEVSGELDLDRLRQAWQHAVDRHPALRTRFVSDGLPHPLQVVLREHPVVIEEHDCTHVPEPAREAWVERFLAADRERGLDVSTAPPSRFALVRTSESTWLFVWTVHHLVTDGYSQRLVSAEVSKAYRALGEGRALEGRPLPLKGYQRWLRDARAATTDDVEYWSQVLDIDPRPTLLPAAEPVEGGTGSGAIEGIVAPELLEALRGQARRLSITMHTLLHCAWGLLLSEYNGGADVVFGTPLAGRAAPVRDVADLVGMLMNTLPTRVDADRTAAVGPWLRTAHDRLLDLQDRVHTGLSDIRRAVGIARGKLFTSLFVFRNFNAEPPVVNDGLTTKGVDVGVVNNGYPLSFTADLDDSLRFALRFDRSFYTNRSVERLADRMLDLLALLAAAEPTEVLGDLLPVPAPAPQIEEEHEASAAPVTGERLTGPARTLKQIWDAVLGIDDVDPDENFFHVGGDSILAFEVAGRARREGITVTVQQILKLRTFNKILDAIGVGKAEATVARTAASASGDPQIDAVIGAMANAAVPGVGVAIIEGGRLLRAFGAGVTKAGGRIPVTAETAFQVCSVSKHVAALGALRLVGDGVLDLDVDIRDYLDGWHPPRDDDGPPLTVRRLLSHTSGLNQLPNFGVPRSAPRAELLDILRGQEPATNPPIRVEFPPSDEFRYSGANFAVLQLILGEVTGEPFAELMRELVFTPLEMTNSSFDQAFPLRRAGKVALGHQDDGSHLPGGWHVYTTAAASGLWTTPTDLARLACDVMRTLRDGDGVLLGTAEAAEMRRPLPGVTYGLGSVAAEGRWFGHSGDGPGFQALTLSTAGDDDGGRGVVIMANRAGRLEFVVDLMVELGFSVPVTREGVAPVGAPAQGVVA